MKLYILLLCMIFSICAGAAQSIRAVSLTCEYTVAPIGIDEQRPILGWRLSAIGKNKMQSAYEILVSDNVVALEKEMGNMWSTGKISSANSINIQYGGKPLQSYRRYYWKVKVYDEQGNSLGWSANTWFETAMFFHSDWKANWIDDGKPAPSKEEDFYKTDRMPVFKKVAKINKTVKCARLYITGVGYYEAYLNGKKIGKDVLSPGWTNFDKRVLYKTYDVTNMIDKGSNVVAILLGNGWYNPLPLRFWGRYNLRDVLAKGRPCTKAQLRIVYVDGSIEEIVTDDSWQFEESGILTNNVYLGETFDAAQSADKWCKDITDRTGKPAHIVPGPSGILQADLQPPVIVQRVIKPVAIYLVSPGVYIADMGVNVAGVARISVNAPRGTKISLRYGEDVYKDGSLNGMTTVAGQIKSNNGGAGAPGVAWQQDCYIAGGSGIETWQPRFTFHVFRYVEISGWPGRPSIQDINGLVLYADLKVDGAFRCSNKLFNQIQDNVLRTFRNNVFSVQSDCAGREKFGYGGDLFCTLESFCYNMDMHNFYKKVLQDFEDDQRPHGGITETAPYVGLHDKGAGDQSGPLGWQLGYPYLIEKLYEFYGDKRIVEKHYASLSRQIEFLEENAKDNLYNQDISDHESLDEKPEAFSASLFYYHHIVLMERFSRLLNKNTEADKYCQLKLRIKNRVLQKFYKGNGVFDNDTQSAQVFGLWYQLLPKYEKPKAVEEMKRTFQIKADHAYTGIFTTKMMFDVFRTENENELGYRITNQKTFPGWGYMVEKGASTIWETWKYSDNVYSQSHPMFGSITEWFYRSILGINSTSVAFKTFIIKPFPVNDLQFASGYYVTRYGRIYSSWKKEKHSFHLQVEIPVNTTAEIYVPFNGNMQAINKSR